MIKVKQKCSTYLNILLCPCHTSKRKKYGIHVVIMLNVSSLRLNELCNIIMALDFRYSQLVRRSDVGTNQILYLI